MLREPPSNQILHTFRSDGAVPDNKSKAWVADVTYLKVKKQWHYLSVIMELYSRRVVGWSLDTQRTTEVTCRTLMNAIRKRALSKASCCMRIAALNIVDLSIKKNSGSWGSCIA